MSKIMAEHLNRRAVILAGAAAAVASATTTSALAAGPAFPTGFRWGAATAGHQVEGNNTNSDMWVVENVKPSLFGEPSGDAVDSFNRWPEDLDICKSIGLNTYRFSIEWARIEPEEGRFSRVMLDHYRRIVAGCRERGLMPIITFNHFTAPRWFGAAGGWTNPKSPDLFTRYCEYVAKGLAGDVDYALTFNEPNLPGILKWAHLPPEFTAGAKAMFAAAARATGSPRFLVSNVVPWEDYQEMQPLMQVAHQKARVAIKGVRPNLPVGLSLAVVDDQAAGSTKVRDQKRREIYEPWFEAAKDDDFLGVQNYERAVYDEKDQLPAPAGAPRNFSGSEVYAASLEGAVRYCHQATRKPIFVTEHGVGTDDDALRAKFIPDALTGLQRAMEDGVPVLGYIHWSLLDNFEWAFGYAPKFGLVAVDRTNFRRTVKPSAAVFGAIARRNAI